MAWQQCCTLEISRPLVPCLHASHPAPAHREGLEEEGPSGSAQQRKGSRGEGGQDTRHYWAPEEKAAFLATFKACPGAGADVSCPNLWASKVLCVATPTAAFRFSIRCILLWSAVTWCMSCETMTNWLHLFQHMAATGRTLRWNLSTTAISGL